MDDALRSLGLSHTEGLLYRALVASGAAELDELAHRCGLAAAEAQRGLESLERHGLAGRSTDAPACWVASPPGVALRALLNDRRHELERAELVALQLAQAHRAERGGEVHDLVEVVVGADAVGQRFHQLQLGAEREISIFVTTEPAVVSSADNKAEDVATRRGVKYRIVLEREGLAREAQQAVVDVLRRDQQIRVVDRLPTKLVIADRRTAMVPVETDTSAPAALIIHARGLVDTLLSLFDSVWRTAWPLVLGPPGSGEYAESSRHLDEIDLQVLSLLLSGASDERVAKQLDISLRTVQRRVRALMDASGATTRIQLGWAASERGWVARP